MEYLDSRASVYYINITDRFKGTLKETIKLDINVKKAAKKYAKIAE